MNVLVCSPGSWVTSSSISHVIWGDLMTVYLYKDTFARCLNFLIELQGSPMYQSHASPDKHVVKTQHIIGSVAPKRQSLS